MELGGVDYSLLSSPYDSFMRKHLQHYGYFSGRADIIKKYGFLPSKAQLASSSSDSESSGSEEEHEKYKNRSSASEVKLPIRQARVPNLNPRVTSNEESSFEPRWPSEIEVLNEPRIKHINIPPSQPEYFYKPTTDHGPFVRSFDENNGRIVYNYNPETSGYFVRSRVGGNREGCRSATVSLQNTEDTTVLFESRFESGNLMKAVQVGEFDYELYLRYDLYTKRNTQWFYFRLQNIQTDKRYRFTIVNFFKSTSLYSSGMKPLLYSIEDAENKGIGWRRWGEEIVYYKNNLLAPDNTTNMYSLTWTCKFPNNNDTYYFAHCYPYTYSDLQDYLNEIQTDRFKNEYCKQKVLCRTLAGNFIYMLTITNPTPPQAINICSPSEHQGKKGVVVTARVHPGETNGSWMMKGLMDFLLGDSADARLLRDNFIFKIIPMLNPDGVIVGNYRCSLSGRDLNRNYKTVLKDAYPSIWHTREMVKRFMTETELVLYCDFHGHSRKQNVFVYGCENKNAPNERLKERIFPAMLSKNDPSKFSYDSCKFKVQKNKEGTGRVVMWSLGIMNSYTLEATFCGSTQGERAGQHFNTKDLESIGYHFLDSLLDYCDPDETKEQYRQKLYNQLLNGNVITQENLLDFVTSYNDSIQRSKTRIDLKREVTIIMNDKHLKIRRKNQFRNIKSTSNLRRSKSQPNMTRNINTSHSIRSRDRVLYELEDNLRHSIQMKLLARGMNPGSLADIDLDQFSSDDDSSEDDGSDSSVDDGLPKHLEVIAAANIRLKKTRKKVPPAKDTKKKDEIDKENSDKNKTNGLLLNKNRNSQFPNIALLETTVNTDTVLETEMDSKQRRKRRTRGYATYRVCKCVACLNAQIPRTEMPVVNELAKSRPSMSARRLHNCNSDPVRIEGATGLINRSNRWPILAPTSISNNRQSTADERARRCQAEAYKLLTRDTATNDREKQSITHQQLLDTILLTSSLYRTQKSVIKKDDLVRYSSSQTNDTHELTLLNDSRGAFTTTYLLRRLNNLERESAITTNIASAIQQSLLPASNVDVDTTNPLTTDNETDLDASRTTLLNQDDDGRHLRSSYVANRVSSQLQERLIGPPRRPRSLTSSSQNRTIIDVQNIQPTNQNRQSGLQQYQKQRVMPKYDERRSRDSLVNDDNSSSTISRLVSVTSNNTTSRQDVGSLNRLQTIRSSNVKKSSK
ncbi:unnamed protein product [Adineta steineri]|uniref:Peptidase M14 domain-containing protein n=1 Tax=Adineta steineri TaxID=433720 RepID=A0A814QLX5_9BILA|nr:unnamed protein product [Adineta steineri]